MQNHNLFPDNTKRLMLHDVEHVAALARHIFKNDVIGMKKVEKTFSHYKTVAPEIKQQKPRDYTMHHIPA